MRLNWVWLATLLISVPASAIAQFPHDDPAWSGYVTRVGSTATDFALQGRTVVLTPKTRFFMLKGKEKTVVATLSPPYLGEAVQIWGRLESKTNTVIATWVETVVPGDVTVSGKGIIDAEEPQVGDERIVRADGFRLRLGATTKMHYNGAIASLSGVSTNVWIIYKGVQGTDGVVDVHEAEVWPNTIYSHEEKSKLKEEFDPAKVQPGEQQSPTGKYLLGTDYKRLPAHKDEALQARVERIGQKLIPAYQKALADTDPTRINFRFQVVEDEKLRAEVALANGIVLVPFPAVQRLTSDVEIATLLADGIAGVLEKQAYRNGAALTTANVAKWAGTAAMFVLPLAGGMTMAASSEAGDRIRFAQEQQSGRVSLWLLHDAGYDLQQAPVAWWKLAVKKQTLEEPRFRNAPARFTWRSALRFAR